MIALLLLFISSVICIDNGIGALPPMGWRSWNCFGGNIDQTKMTSIIDAIADRSRSVNGKPTSLADLGYTHVGLDDNWQNCGAGVNGSFHNANGDPIINTQRFPNMQQMNQNAHQKNVKPGWYMNNCICSESGKLQANWPPQMHGDVNTIVSLGYDGVKIDGCGPSHNLLEWAEFINTTGRPIMIENCHDNTTFPYWNNPRTFDKLVCPMNFWRVSGDISANWNSIINNLQQTIRFQDLQHPMSQPGCWAYPDMLEVANGQLTLDESRSHFGAWCVVSSPLILGFDLTNTNKMNQVWDVITNTEAIAVSQTWAGHPGRLLSQATEKIILEVPYTERDKIRLERMGITHNGYQTTAVGAWQIWSKTLQSNAQAALLLNTGSASTTISLRISELGFSATEKVTVRSIWDHKDIGVMTGADTYSVTLAAHDSSFVRITPS
jgi:alpha-galactosidase